VIIDLSQAPARQEKLPLMLLEFADASKQNGIEFELIGNADMKSLAAFTETKTNPLFTTVQEARSGGKNDGRSSTGGGIGDGRGVDGESRPQAGPGGLARAPDHPHRGDEVHGVEVLNRTEQAKIDGVATGAPKIIWQCAMRTLDAIV
jgi:hypothetical protein